MNIDKVTTDDLLDLLETFDQILSKSEKAGQTSALYEPLARARGQVVEAARYLSLKEALARRQLDNERDRNPGGIYLGALPRFGEP